MRIIELLKDLLLSLKKNGKDSNQLDQRRSFGHEFFSIYISKENYSYSFVEFMDLVWQVMLQFPESFEFDEHLLITILDEIFSARFGNFITNNNKEMEEAKIPMRTASLWNHILENKEEFLNPEFVQTASYLVPVVNYKSIHLWRSYYTRQNVRPVKISLDTKSVIKQ